MGFRMRRSVQIVPGVRFNVSKTGVGLGFGPRGLRYTVHTSGRRTFTARSGVPGVYYQTQRHSSGGPSRRPAAVSKRAVPQQDAKPGMFAPRGEKDLYQAILRQSPPAAIARIGDEHADYMVLAYSLAGLLMLNGDDLPEVTRLLSAAFAPGDDPGAHPFTQKYLQTEIQIHVATGVTVNLPVNRDAVGLALAEAYQHTGAVEKAIDVVEQLHPTTHAAVSLADLYTEAKRYNDVVELTDGSTNQDDASMLLVIFRGVALREQGLYEAAQVAFKEALRYRSRPAELRHLALLERSHNFAAQGKKAQARKDLEHIIAEDSAYPGVREQLAALTDDRPAD
jgi:tetratricopeptide (TPR) repeat protein